MKLSILICSLHERFNKLSVLLTELNHQAAGKDAEVLWLGDFKAMSVGEKRNKLLSIASGDYVSFIDDDDMVSPDYIVELLNNMPTNPHVICFECLYHNAETGIKNHVYFGREHLNVNEDSKGVRYRMPNHLCAIKRTIALKAGFEKKSFGEDSDFAFALRNKFLLHSEIVIPKILYYYQFNPKTSATWMHSPVNAFHHQIIKLSNHQINPPVTMDVVIAGNGFTPALRRMTQDCITSLAQRDDLNVIVMEKNAALKYKGADTFPQPAPFNYNRCLNEGALKGNAEYICFSNNDIGFCDGFAYKALQEMKAKGLDAGGVKDHRGYEPRNNITGWCFIIRRDAWLKIGKLNEDYTFYCSDNAVWKQLQDNNLLYGILQNVNCYHNISATKNRLDAPTRKEYTDDCVKKFNRQYNENLLNVGV